MNNININSPMQKIANRFKKEGISVLEQMDETQLSQFLIEANDAYYNDIPFLTDNQFDIIKEYVENKYPSNPTSQQVGAPLKKNKVVLPYPMGSMNKIKPDTNALENWCAKYSGPYVLSCKLDGVSGLYSTQNNSQKLYPRGDGHEGQDISHLIPYLRLPKKSNIVVRGEFIMPKAIFEDKYKSSFANPRNMVAGIINQKTVNNSILDVHFVAYELIYPVLECCSKQLEFLSTLDIEVVNNFQVGSNSLTNNILSDTLIDWRENSVYEIDGVIVANDQPYKHKSGNPDHAFAFKMVLTDQIAEAKVVDVIWTPSKDGYLKPRIQIEPIHLGGVCITYATGFNAAFISTNNIGIGAVVELIRSGDVIPYIRDVIVPAEFPKMPSVPYVWNDTDIDIIIEDISSDETVREKNITGFFKGIGVDGLSSGNIRRLMDTGYDTIKKIIRMNIEDFLLVDGFKDKMAQKIYYGIQEKLANASLLTLMACSNLFGRGINEKKIELILNDCPDILVSDETEEQKITRISSVKGMANKTAELFVKKIPVFIRFMDDLGLYEKLLCKVKPTLISDTYHPLYNKTVVLTGFRDEELQNKLKNCGAKIGSSVSSKTFMVIIKNNANETGKVAEARKLGTLILTAEELKNEYHL